MNERKHDVKIVCFAGLRKYLQPELSLLLEFPLTYADLLHQLGMEHPEAIQVLKNCRIAVEEVFVPATAMVDPAKTVFLIPPSSGG